jgi:hypothetical protein
LSQGTTQVCEDKEFESQSLSKMSNKEGAILFPRGGNSILSGECQLNLLTRAVRLSGWMTQIQEMHSRNRATEREEDAWNAARDSNDGLGLRMIVNKWVSWLSFLNVSQSWDQPLPLGAGA